MFRFLSEVAATTSDLEIQTSKRTVQVNFAEIKERAIKIFTKGFALAWAVKFALEGLKLKPGDFVIYKGSKMTAEDFTAKISDQSTNPGYVKTESGGIGKISDKSVLSVKRLVRAFAADITFLLKNGLKQDSDIVKVGALVGLSSEYSFIDSVYGCDDATVKTIALPYLMFCAKFDMIIDSAYSSGWVETISKSKKQSHFETAVSYLKWRGFNVSKTQVDDILASVKAAA